MTHVSTYHDQWMRVFASHKIDKEIAQGEWNEWAAGLDGECDNEYTQNSLSVIDAAEEAVKELHEYEE